MSYIVQFHPLTQKDYYDAYEWYEEQQKGLGERFIKAVRTKIEEITAHPEVFGKRSNQSFREAQVDFFPFLIVFKASKQKQVIYISSIHHTKKHPRKKFRKE